MRVQHDSVEIESVFECELFVGVGVFPEVNYRDNPGTAIVFGGGKLTVRQSAFIGNTGRGAGAISICIKHHVYTPNYYATNYECIARITRTIFIANYAGAGAVSSQTGLAWQAG